MSHDEDTLRPPSRALFLTETPRALSEMALLGWFAGPLRAAPRGDGHPVMVLPGFTATDDSTRVLRRFLERWGYATHGWGLGRNLGPDDSLQQRMQERVEELFLQHGERLSLVGQSLGGIYAREIARQAPEIVRQVITLGSPFAGVPGAASNVQTLYEDVTGTHPEQIDSPMLEHLGEAPPVPTSAVYSRADGIVHWRSCVQRDGEQAENIEVPGSHCGMGFNALVLYAVADRLAQPDEEWRTFERRGMRRGFYPDPVPCQGTATVVDESPHAVAEDLAKLASDIGHNAAEAVISGSQFAERAVDEITEDVMVVAGDISPAVEEVVTKGIEGTDRSLREIGIFEYLGFAFLTEASSALTDGLHDLRLSALERARTGAEHHLDGLRAVTEARSLEQLVSAERERRRKLAENRREGLKEAGRIVSRTARKVTEPLGSLSRPFAGLVKREWESSGTSSDH